MTTFYPHHERHRADTTTRHRKCPNGFARGGTAPFEAPGPGAPDAQVQRSAATVSKPSPTRPRMDLQLSCISPGRTRCPPVGRHDETGAHRGSWLGPAYPGRSSCHEPVTLDLQRGRSLLALQVGSRANVALLELGTPVGDMSSEPGRTLERQDDPRPVRARQAACRRPSDRPTCRRLSRRCGLGWSRSPARQIRTAVIGRGVEMRTMSSGSLVRTTISSPVRESITAPVWRRRRLLRFDSRCPRRRWRSPRRVRHPPPGTG